MPWKEVSTMSQRHEFMLLAQQPGTSLRALCRRFEISPPTAYKWLARYATAGVAGLADRSRRPHQTPHRTAPDLEAAVVTLRTQHPTWGGRKLHARLRALGYQPVPAPSTITAILRRTSGLPATAPPRAWQRFAHTTPNALWQMDFKGHFALATGRCHPLTVLDDCSRFALCLHACPNEQGRTVQTHLTQTFRRYGLPARLLMDNGPPWGVPLTLSPFTALTVWLMRLGITLTHARPAHPQTLGKDERFHRTLKAELLHQRTFRDLPHCQQHFDRWRDHYNLDRPHDALALAVPAMRYTPSPRPFPEALPPIDYGPDAHVRRVQDKGVISFRGRAFHVTKALRGYPVALRPTTQEGRWRIYFCHQYIRELDLHAPSE